MNKIQICLALLLTILSVCSCENKSNYENISSDSHENKIVSSEKGGDSKDSDAIIYTLKTSQFGDLSNFDLSSDKPILVGDDYYVFGKTTISLEKNLYKNDDLKLSFDIINETNSEIYSDSSFQIEILVDGNWKIIPPTNYYFNDLFGIYPEHGRYKYSIDLGEIDFSFPKGEYRLLKIFSMQDFKGTILCESKFTIV